ncbi:hypothetical protein JCM39068_22710 [Desulfocastanea catecholica]
MRLKERIQLSDKENIWQQKYCRQNQLGNGSFQPSQVIQKLIQQHECGITNSGKDSIKNTADIFLRSNCSWVDSNKQKHPKKCDYNANYLE